jgi:uncharacterized protein (DUF924 family)
MSTSAEILTFWFGAPAENDEAFKHKLTRWYRASAEFDREIEAKFGSDVEGAATGALNVWMDEPRPCLALVVLLDQFTRNIYRGTPKAYALDPVAQRIVLGGYERGFERAFGLEERLFFMMPLVHAEDLALQDKAVDAMARLAADAPPSLREGYAIGVKEVGRHREEIRRFRRFPARNAVVGRASTAEEIAYLESLKVAAAPY